MYRTRREPFQPARFNTTQWSRVLRAGGTESEEVRTALGELIQIYWYPLYAFCRRRGNNDHDAQDLTQGFFSHLLSATRGLNSVTPEKGRFRTFLMVAFRNYMTNEHRAAKSARRGGTVSILSTDQIDFESRYDREFGAEEDAERIYERNWAEALMERVHDRLASDYAAAGKSELFNLLESHLTHRDDAIPRTEVGATLGLSPAAVNMSLYRMRRRYGEILRDEVAATLDDPADIDDELLTLMRAISHSD